MNGLARKRDPDEQLNSRNNRTRPHRTRNDGRRLTGKQTLVGSEIDVAIALAIFLSWLYFWSGSNSFSVSEAGRSGGGFDGDSVPSIAPSPVGERPFRVTIGDADSKDEAAASKAAGAPDFLTSGGSADVANALGTRQIISLGLLFFGAYRMELRKED